MNWKTKTIVPLKGDIRIIKKFLFFPKSFKVTINEPYYPTYPYYREVIYKERKWWENAYILQKYKSTYSNEGWFDEKFINLSGDQDIKSLNEMLQSSSEEDRKLAIGIIEQNK